MVGGTYSPKVNLNAKSNFIARTYIGELNNIELFFDTIDYSEERGSVIIPARYGLGFSLSRRDHWFFGFDYNFDKWEDYRNFDRSDSLVNSHTFAAGGQFIPDYASTSYINRIEYRIGARFSQSYLKLRDTQINGFGIPFGVGLPLRSPAIRGTRSKINIGIEAGRRGTIEKGLIQENYINIYFGVSINELWFFKRRYQ